MSNSNEIIDLSDVCIMMLQSPRAQFNIYLSSRIPASQQRELISYRGGRQRGSIKRLQDGVPSQSINANDLERWLIRDLIRYDNCFYTFMSAPVFGLTADSENREYRHQHEQLFPTPIHMRFSSTEPQPSWLSSQGGRRHQSL
jgi:hypothetical protein